MRRMASASIALFLPSFAPSASARGRICPAQRQRGGPQRGHRLADARRRLREEPLSLPDGDVHVRGERPLPRAIRAVGKTRGRKAMRPAPAAAPAAAPPTRSRPRTAPQTRPSAARRPPPLHQETNGRAVFHPHIKCADERRSSPPFWQSMCPYIAACARCAGTSGFSAVPNDFLP